MNTPLICKRNVKTSKRRNVETRDEGTKGRRDEAAIVACRLSIVDLKTRPTAFGFQLAFSLRRFVASSLRRSPFQSTISNRQSTIVVLSICAAAAFVPSCTFGGGELLYNLGFGKSKKVPAQYRLTDARLLIFIDDVTERVDWPPAQAYLFDDLSQALLRNKAAQKIIPLETIEAHRRSMENFNKLSCREIGELVEADQVLWIESKDFMAEEDFADAGAAALWTASVRVIDPKQKQARSLVRLWPTSPEGQIITATLAPGEVLRLKSKDAIAKELAAKLAVEISHLFYDWQPDDP